MNKIIFFLQSFHIGGAEKVLITLANQFYKNNYDVKIIVKEKKGKLITILDKNIEIISLEKNQLKYSILQFIKIIYAQKPDYIYSTIFNMNIYVLIICKILKINAKIIVRESIFLSEKLSQYSLLSRYFFKFLISWSYNLADFIIAPSKFIKNDLIKNFNIKEKKIFTIFNPVDYYAIKDQSSEKIDCLSIDSKKFNLITVARLVKQKNIIFLLKVVKEILNTNKINNLNLYIVGDGPLFNDLYKYIETNNLSKKIFLLGEKTNPYKYISKADIYVQSSLFEGSPNSLIHAILLKKPVIAFDCNSGPREILMNGKYGELIDINDKEAFTKAIINYSKKNKIIDNSYLIDKYLPENIIKKYISILK